MCKWFQPLFGKPVKLYRCIYLDNKTIMGFTIRGLTKIYGIEYEIK